MSFIHQNQKYRGFTLVELLVVITIIGILAGLATGVAIYVRGSAVDTVTKSQLSQMEMALEAYKNEFGEYPPMLSDANGVRRHASSRWKRASFSPDAYTAILTELNLPLDESTDTPAEKAQKDSLRIAASLTFWLGGLYSPATGSYVGFSANLEDPLGTKLSDPFSGQRTEVRFDFSEKNTLDIPGTAKAKCFAVYDKPVVYFRSTSVGDANAYMQNVNGNMVPLFCDMKELGIAVPYAKSASPVVWHGAKKYQLLHPGRDSDFGDHDPTVIYYTGDGGNVPYEAENNITSFTDTATLRGALNP